MEGVLRVFVRPGGCIKRIVDIKKILEIRVIFTDFGGTCSVAGSLFIAPRHLQTRHVSETMSHIREELHDRLWV